MIHGTCAKYGASYGQTFLSESVTWHGLNSVGKCSHLLVTRPSKSRALECFVVEIAHKSTHIAMLVRVVLLCTLGKC